MNCSIHIKEMKSLENRNEGTIILNDNIINIILGDNFCFLSSDSIDLSNANMYLSKMKGYNIDKILSYLKDTLIQNDKITNTIDYLNLFKREKEKTKNFIDFKLFPYKVIEKSTEKTNVRSNIPKQLQLDTKEVYELIISEIKKVNSDLSHNHYIHIDNDVYNVSVRLRYLEGELGEKLKIMKERYSLDYFELEFSLDNILYPFCPPKISYRKPNINSELISSILNLNNFESNNWNYTISLNMYIKELANKLEQYFNKYLDINTVTKSNVELSDLDRLLIELGDHFKISNSNINIKLDLLTNLSSDETNKNSYWKSGTGYGSGNKSETWNINDYLNNQQNFNQTSCILIDSINYVLKKENCYDIAFNNNIFQVFLKSQLSGLSILEIDKNKGLYTIIYELIENCIKYTGDSNNILKTILNESLSEFIIDINMLMNVENDLLKEHKNIYDLLVKFKDLYELFKEENDVEKISNTTNKSDMYKELVNKHQFKDAPICNYHKFIKYTNTKPNTKSVVRIMTEINSLRKNLPNNWDSSILMRISKTNLNLLTFLIIGPKDTPYHNGVYEFHAYFPDDYPKSPPKVLLNTTDGGRVRFNPNLYNCGKVCLSLLGTWSGDRGESWNPQISTFLQVLISIQSLILVENPYFNEPGYEKSMNTNTGKQRNFAYTENIRLENMKVAILGVLTSEYDNEYLEFIKQHFKLKQEEILKTILIWISESKEKKSLMHKYYELIKIEFSKL
jgi:ubiquitin-protein ligase